MATIAISIGVFLLIFSILFFTNTIKSKNENNQNYTTWLCVGVILVALFVTAWVVLQGNTSAISGLLLLVVATIGVGRNIKRQR
jgi:multidrug transporter EmrE-like cation transporter